MGDGLPLVHGDLAQLAGLTALDDLRLYGTAVRGDVASLAGAHGLRILYLQGLPSPLS